MEAETNASPFDEETRASGGTGSFAPPLEAELPFPCQKGCGRAFKSIPARNMHEIRAHGRGWNTSKNFGKRKTRKYRFPSDDPAYRKARYGKTHAKTAVRNGTTKPPAQTDDHMGEAARAIIVAAQVLRSVGIGLKL